MKKAKQVIAIICIVLLLGMYIATFVMSLVDHSATLSMFKGCVALTIFIPVVAYIYICLHKYAMTRSGRKNYYDTDPGSSDKDPS